MTQPTSKPTNAYTDSRTGTWRMWDASTPFRAALCDLAHRNQTITHKRLQSLLNIHAPQEADASVRQGLISILERGHAAGRKSEGAKVRDLLDRLGCPEDEQTGTDEDDVPDATHYERSIARRLGRSISSLRAEVEAAEAAGQPTEAARPGQMPTPANRSGLYPSRRSLHLLVGSLVDAGVWFAVHPADSPRHLAWVEVADEHFGLLQAEAQEADANA